MECKRCGRKFAPERIAAHEKICNKLKEVPPDIAVHRSEDEIIQQRKERNEAGFDADRYQDMGAGAPPFYKKPSVSTVK